jgi:hypothetical protein
VPLGKHSAAWRPLRAVAVLVLTAGSGPALAVAAWPLLADSPAHAGPTTLADLVASACAALALVAWAWLSLGVCACWRSTRQGARVPPAWAPRLAHLLVAAALGVTLPTFGATASPSTPSTIDLLDGLPIPDRAVGTRASRPPALTHDARTVRVRAGDCLWDLAEARLPGTASPQEVERAWRSLYRANRARVGPDPDLLRPGTALVLPATLDRTPSSGGPR